MFSLAFPVAVPSPDSFSLVDFSLELTTPSIIYEQEKVELYTSKTAVAKEMLDSKMFSKDWIYENIFSLSPDQYNQEKDNFNWNVIDEVGDVFKIAENVSLEFVEELVKELDFVLHKRNESLGKRKRKSIGVPRGLGA